MSCPCPFKSQLKWWLIQQVWCLKKLSAEITLHLWTSEAVTELDLSHCLMLYRCSPFLIYLYTYVWKTAYKLLKLQSGETRSLWSTHYHPLLLLIVSWDNPLTVYNCVSYSCVHRFKNTSHQECKRTTEHTSTDEWMHIQEYSSYSDNRAFPSQNHDM
jgi:hypothetical protein